MINLARESSPRPQGVVMELKPGSRLRSAVCSTEVVVVRAAPRLPERQYGTGTFVAGRPPPQHRHVAGRGRLEGVALGLACVALEFFLDLLFFKALLQFGGPGSRGLADLGKHLVLIVMNDDVIAQFQVPNIDSVPYFQQGGQVDLDLAQ